MASNIIPEKQLSELRNVVMLLKSQPSLLSLPEFQFLKDICSTNASDSHPIPSKSTAEQNVSSELRCEIEENVLSRASVVVQKHYEDTLAHCEEYMNGLVDNINSELQKMDEELNKVERKKEKLEKKLQKKTEDLVDANQHIQQLQKISQNIAETSRCVISRLRSENESRVALDRKLKSCVAEAEYGKKELARICQENTELRVEILHLQSKLKSSLGKSHHFKEVQSEQFESTVDQMEGAQSRVLEIQNPSHFFTEKELRQEFGVYGAIGKIKMSTNSSFLFFEEHEEASKAKSHLNGSSFKGRVFEVEFRAPPLQQQKKEAVADNLK